MNKNGYRLISLFGIVAAVGVLAWAVAAFAGHGAPFGTAPAAGESTEIPIGDCKAVEASGIWDIELSQGKAQLRLYAAPEQAKNVEIVQDGATLRLKTRNVLGSGYRVGLSLPSLERLDLRGGARVALGKSKLPALAVAVDGAGNIVVDDCTIGDLRLDCRGTSVVDAGGSRIANAHVALSGVVNVTLGMAGGVLDGSLDGAGRLLYSGELASQTVRVGGLGSVERLAATPEAKP